MNVTAKDRELIQLLSSVYFEKLKDSIPQKNNRFYMDLYWHRKFTWKTILCRPASADG